MALRLPNLDEGRVIRLVVCGSVDTKFKQALDYLKVDRQLIASFRRKKSRYFVRLLTGGRKPRHFHIEIASTRWFADKGLPTINSKIGNIESGFSIVKGQDITANVAADFDVRTKELPESGPIRVLSARAEAAGVSIELTGGVLAVRGSQICRVSWSRIDDNRTRVTLHAYVSIGLSNSYLCDCQDLMEDFFTTLVLARRSKRL